MSWFSRLGDSHRFQLGVAAVLSGAISISAYLAIKELRRTKRLQDIKDSIPEDDEAQNVRIYQQVVRERVLTYTKLTDWGTASDAFAPSKEDERSAALALRARQGDYDDGRDGHSAL